VLALSCFLGATSAPVHGQSLPEPTFPTLPPAATEKVGGTPQALPSPYNAPVGLPPSPSANKGLPTLPGGLPKAGLGQPGAQPPFPQPMELPKPSPVPGFGPNQLRLPCLPGTLGATPVPKEEVQKRYGKYIQGLLDTEATLDLVVARTRLMVLKTSPKRVQVADDSVAGYTIISPTQISLLGKSPGVTVLTMWFQSAVDPTKEEILSYHVRVYPDPEAKRRLEAVYEALTREINCLFPDSNVCLKLVGDKIAVTGFAHDVEQAAKILQIVRANAPDPRDPRPEAVKVPADRIKAGLLPGEVLPPGVVPIGLEQYEVMGGANVINLLKVTGEQQVMLRVTVAEVNRAAARSIGLNFTITNSSGTAVFANNTGAIATGGTTPAFAGGGGGLGFLNFSSGNTFGIPPFAGFPAGVGGFNNLPAALDNGQIRLAISALRTLNYARSLAEPNLVALNGQSAEFQAGGQFPVPVVTGFTNAGLQGVNFVPFGVSLRFTPFITDRDRVRLVVAAEVSTRDLAAGLTNIGGAGVPSLTSRNFQTTVELREGQTLAVAGLIQNNLGADASRIPFIGDLPVLSRLLGFDRITAGEQELVVLITPELVHPMEHHEVPPLPGSDLFEPTDLEFYLCGRIESHYPIDYRSPVRTDWGRLHRQFESMYLFGPHGHVPEH
jgi:pilus assembly protein CpaC